MLIENEFIVAAPPDALWSYLLDVERIAPCMPGAELTDIVDDRTWKGKLNVKFGPVALSFAGTVTMTERDDEAHRVMLSAKGMEQKGKGAASASVTSWLELVEGRTKVKMQSEIRLSGAAAQMSRGLLPEASKLLTRQFAECLESSMKAEQTSVEATATALVEEGTSGNSGASSQAPRNQPVGGVRLGLAAMWALLKNLLRRLFGRQASS